jgi:hypothetical protein
VQDDKFLGAVLCQVAVRAATIAIHAGGSWWVLVVSGNDVVGGPHTGEAHVVWSSTSVAYHARGLVVVKVPGIFVGFGGQALTGKVSISYLASPTRLGRVSMSPW